jgi:predicted DNA-binding transcriptional regulator YafY
MAKNLVSYGLPMPHTARLLPSQRVSPVKSLLARLAAKGRRPNPQQQFQNQPAQKPDLGPRQNQPEAPKKKTWSADPRDVLATIAEAAKDHKIVMLQYRKATAGGALVNRAVEPYSLRYRSSKTRGRARYLYAYNVAGSEEGIHAFLVSNIVSVTITDQTYQPRWRVEF